MPTNIVVPELGESVVEATVAQWLEAGGRPRHGGRAVRRARDRQGRPRGGGRRRPASWRASQRQPGETVKVGDVLGTIEEAGGAASRQACGRPTAGGSGTPRRQLLAVGEQAAPGTGQPSGRRRSHAAWRRSTRSTSAQVKPGAGGRVTKDDVERYLAQETATPSAAPAASAPAPAPHRQPNRRQRLRPLRPPPAAPAAPMPSDGREERERMSRRRQTIARRLVEAQHTAAMLTTFNEVDMTR